MPPPANPRISVVIATHNRRASLLRTLQTLFRQDVAPDAFEIIIVADGSTDGTAAALRELPAPCSLQVLERPQGGISAARNQGIRAASGEVVLILDDDLLCAPDLIRRHLEVHENAAPQVVVGAFPISPESSRTLAAECYKQNARDWEAHYARDSRLHWPHDAAVEPNTSIPMSIIEKYGAFDESIPYQREDSEIGMRYWLKGVPFRYLPAAAAQHVVMKKTRDMICRDAVLYGKHDLLLARKLPEYRPFSVPARIAQGPWALRAARRMFMALPFPPASLISAMLWPFEKLQNVSFIRRAGIKFLQYGSSAVAIRSAARDAESWKVLRREFGRRLPVFAYHHIGEVPRPWVPGLSVPTEVFERQIRWLARRGFKSIRSADWLDWVRAGKPLPEKAILLTFDDAYADLARFALPVLQRYGFTGLVLVVTSRIGETAQWGELAGYPLMKLMDKDQIRHWAREGIEFGAHSRTHADLTRLSPGNLAEEIAASQKDLEELLQVPVRTFAYPYGASNESVRAEAGRAFDICFGIDEGMNDIGSNLHSLRRIMILPQDSAGTLRLKSRFGFDPASRFLHRLLRPVIRTFFGSAENPHAPRAA